MKPRVYTYKITFEETSDWYWGAHKEVKYGEPYMGTPTTHSWKWSFYTPVKQILEEFEFSNTGWMEALAVEQRLIRPDLNNPLCLNEGCGGIRSLKSCSEGGRKGGLITSSIPGQMSRAGAKSGLVWTDAKLEALKRNSEIARQHQKDRGIQIYGPDFEYFRRKGRLTRFGVKIDGVRHRVESLSETFIEYHLKLGNKGTYNNPS